MCVWGEQGEDLLELRGFAGCSHTCFVQEKCKSSFPKKRLVLSVLQLIAEEHHLVFKTGCKICSIS